MLTHKTDKMSHFEWSGQESCVSPSYNSLAGAEQGSLAPQNTTQNHHFGPRSLQLNINWFLKHFCRICFGWKSLEPTTLCLPGSYSSQRQLEVCQAQHIVGPQCVASEWIWIQETPESWSSPCKPPCQLPGHHHHQRHLWATFTENGTWPSEHLEQFLAQLYLWRQKPTMFSL